MRRKTSGNRNPTHRMSFPLAAQSQAAMSQSLTLNGTSPASSSEFVGEFSLNTSEIFVY